MPAIENQRAIRECSKLPFCYLCGKTWAESGLKPTRDHVPPKAIFATEDRAVTPLILPVHCKCNIDQSIGDEIIGQLVSVLRAKYPDPQNIKLKVGVVPGAQGDDPLAVLHGPDLRPLVWRIIKGFHAALYREPLDVGGKANVHMPFPQGQRLPNGRLRFDEILPQQRAIAEEIKKNRLARRLDRVSCFNDKCIYECVWVRGDAGEPICMFALRLYDWEKLADPRFRQRGCVGIYSPNSGQPATATAGTSLMLPTGGNPLDPFHDGQSNG